MKRLITILVLLLLATPASAGCGPRPPAWCGWWMRCHVPIDPGKAFDVALEWAKYGRWSPGPCVGCIVVWNRGKGKGHVGVITRQTETGWVVKSGNDNHAVRERERPVVNAYAFRIP